MILVDTSVWISYFRGGDPRLRDQLQSLLDEDRVLLAVPVKIEILGGSRARDLSRLRRVLAALPLLVPSDPTWARIERWIDGAVAKGHRFGVADLLVAALAAEREALLWSLDSDFTRMERLGFVRLYPPSP